MSEPTDVNSKNLKSIIGDMPNFIFEYLELSDDVKEEWKHGINASDFGGHKQFVNKFATRIEQYCQEQKADLVDELIEARAKEAKLLHALAGMYEQYCGKKFGHDFMGAGEEAIELLEEYGIHSEDAEWDNHSDENLARRLAELSLKSKEQS